MAAGEASCFTNRLTSTPCFIIVGYLDFFDILFNFIIPFTLRIDSCIHTCINLFENANIFSKPRRIDNNAKVIVVVILENNDYVFLILRAVLYIGELRYTQCREIMFSFSLSLFFFSLLRRDDKL